MPELVLIRGLPGSGKSTMAIEEYSGHEHFEADMYHLNYKGEYVFQAENVRAAHEWCYQSARIALSRGHDVVVSNTFSQRWEMAKYLLLPYPTKIIVASGEYKNRHNVPEDVIQRMRERWEEVT